MNNQSLVGLFESLIHKDWQLPQEAGYWIVTETAKEATHTQIKIGGCKSIAFSLDINQKNAWPFLTVALEGVRSVCDAIIIAENNQKTYCLILDMKSSIAGHSKAIKQIRSNYHFMQWLISLLELHNHWQDKIYFAGIVSLKPRKTEAKGTSKRPAIPQPQKNIFAPEFIFSLENHYRIVLPEIIKVIEQQTL